MPFSPRLVLRALPFTLLLAVYACSDDDAAAPATPSSDAGTVTPGVDAASEAGDAAAPTEAVSFVFAGRIGEKPFKCGETYADVGTSKATATAGDLRFFVHAIRLSKGAGAPAVVKLDDRDLWQGSQVGLVDLEDKTGECSFGTAATNDTLTGTVAPGDYDTITFELGVPDDLNHVNVELAGPPFTASKLQWDWANGFIHFAAQANPTAMIEGDGGQVRAPSFYSHLGSTGCSGDPADGGTGGCARKNRPTVTISGFAAAKDKIVVDLAQLWAGSNLDDNTAGTMSGCMSGPADPECGPVFAQLGLDFATGAVNAAKPQVVFSAAPR